MKTTAHCDQNRLDLFLNGELPEFEEQLVIRHLDECQACRQRLDDSLGGESWSKEVRRTLSSTSVDQSLEETACFPIISSDDGEVEAAAALKEQTLAALRSCLGPSDDPRMLGRIGQYEVVGIVGRGATGIVVKAFQSSLNRYVAIKVLAPELAANAAARQRFAREAQAAAAVVNEHVVPIYSVEEYRGTPFLVMQYVAGGSLEHRLRDEGVVTPQVALRIGMQIATGLAAAHSQGLIHRDIKPANILLENGLERVLITDFGLARAVDDATLTHSGFVAGTPQFMSPEQARGEVIDHRTDLFSLGTVLYTLLAGRPPFRAETAYGILRRICDDPHRPLTDVIPSTPRWLSQLVDRFLQKDPLRRPTTALDAAAMLEAALAHVQNPAAFPLPRDLRESRAARWVRSVPQSTVRLGSLCLLLAAFVGLWANRPNHSVVVPQGPPVEEVAYDTLPFEPGSVPAVVVVRVPDAQQIDAELIAIERLVQQFEAHYDEQPIVAADAWRSDVMELFRQMQQFELLGRLMENPVWQKLMLIPAPQTVDRELPSPKAPAAPKSPDRGATL